MTKELLNYVRFGVPINSGPAHKIEKIGVASNFFYTVPPKGYYKGKKNKEHQISLHSLCLKCWPLTSGYLIRHHLL